MKILAGCKNAERTKCSESFNEISMLRTRRHKKRLRCHKTIKWRNRRYVLRRGSWLESCWTSGQGTSLSLYRKCENWERTHVMNNYLDDPKVIVARGYIVTKLCICDQNVNQLSLKHLRPWRTYVTGWHKAMASREDHKNAWLGHSQPECGKSANDMPKCKKRKQPRNWSPKRGKYMSMNQHTRSHLTINRWWRAYQLCARNNNGVHCHVSACLQLTLQ